MLVAEAVAATVAAAVPDPDEAAWLLGHAGQAAVVIGVDAGAAASGCRWVTSAVGYTSGCLCSLSPGFRIPQFAGEKFARWFPVGALFGGSDPEEAAAAAAAELERQAEAER